MTDLLAAALEYAAAGVYVFPARIAVVDGHKQVSPVASWREASSRTSDTIVGWFGPGARWADASLCIDCGKSNLVVVDLDEGEGKAGLAVWAGLLTEYSIPITPVRSRTPSGGEHWYYREHPRRVVGIDSSGKVAHGVDIRGLGGFVIAWPSEDARGPYGEIDIEALPTVPVVPDLVIERMNARSAPDSPSGVVATVTPPSAPQQREDLWRSVAPPRTFTVDQARDFCGGPLAAFRALRTPEDSGFNAKLNDLACAWSHFVPAFMTAEQAEATLYDAAAHNRSVEWQGEAAIRSTIRSGLRQTRDPWKAVRVEDGDTTTSQSDAIDEDVRRELWRREVRRRADDIEHAQAWIAPTSVGDLGTWLEQPRRRVRFRIDGLLGVGHNATIVAQRKTGKTTLIDNLVRCYADGHPFLNRFEVTPTDRTVAIFNYEVEAEQYRDWLRETGIVNTNRVHVLNLRGVRLPLVSERVQAWVIDWLTERNVGLWVIDPYSRAYVGSVDNGNDESQVGRFLDAIDVVKREAGVDESVMGVHTPKAEVEEGHETSIGSQRLEAWPDAMWYLTRQREKGTRFLRAEGRDVELPERELNYDPLTRSLALDLDSGTRAQARVGEEVGVLVEFVRAHPGCSGREIKDEMGWRSDRFDRVRKTARDMGLVRWVEAGRGMAQTYTLVDQDEGSDD